MEKRKRVNASEKIMILKEHLENNIQIGELAEKYQVHPNAIYSWKKALFEKGEILFENQKGKSDKKVEDKISRLEKKLREKDNVIGEIVGDNIRLKKKLIGEN